jgi:hypothetical protein
MGIRIITPPKPGYGAPLHVREELNNTPGVEQLVVGRGSFYITGSR